MSKKEISRLEIIHKLEEKALTKVIAAKQLNITPRQLRRIKKRYELYGPAGLVSKHRGRKSNNRLSDDVKAKIIKLVTENYSDFGPTLAQEKLLERHDIRLSVESLRNLMMANGLWKTKSRKKLKVHQMRQRRPCYGELVQIDGSPHAWFEGRGPKCTLLVFIDDATSRIMQLYFETQESSQGYFDATRAYINKHGRPLAFYSDKHSIFRVNIKEATSGNGETQFSRAMRELDIKLINANSPQAKGRVEKANQTLQDRLVKEMRLKGISDIETANKFLPEFVEHYNNKFAVQAKDTSDMHRQNVHTEDELSLILCQKCTRTITKNLEVHYNNKIYQIQTNNIGYTMRHSKVEVIENKEKVTLRYKGRLLTYKTFTKNQRPTPIVGSKQINNTIDKITKINLRPKQKNKPKHNHPWRQYKEKTNKTAA